MDSEDKKLFDMVGDVLIKAQKNVTEIDEDCRIALIFEKNGRSCIKQFLSMPHHSKNVSFERSRIYEGSCKYNIRCLMDNDFINEIAELGYFYDSNHSTSEVLSFLNSQTLE